MKHEDVKEYYYNYKCRKCGKIISIKKERTQDRKILMPIDMWSLTNNARNNHLCENVQENETVVCELISISETAIPEIDHLNLGNL